MTDPIEQQLRKELALKLDHLAEGAYKAFNDPNIYIAWIAQNTDEILGLFDTYAARRAGLGDSDSPSETAPALRNQVDTSILESIKTAARNGKIAMPDPRMYGTDWRDVTITLHNIYDIPLWREWVTDLTTDSPDTNIKAVRVAKSAQGKE